MATMKILDTSGHQTLDLTKEEEEAYARARFQEFVVEGKTLQAYAKAPGATEFEKIKKYPGPDHDMLLFPQIQGGC